MVVGVGVGGCSSAEVKPVLDFFPLDELVWGLTVWLVAVSTVST